MSNTFLKPLTSIGIPNLIDFDRDAMALEIVDRIKSDPNWNSLWDGELLQNAAWMIVNTFAYLFSKNAEAANRLLREVFITEARDPQSIANILNSYGINFKQNTDSIVPVSVTTSNGGLFTNSFSIDPGFVIVGRDIDGNESEFEIFNTDQSDPSKIDYTAPITINSGFKTIVTAYSGRTTRIDVEIPPAQREKFIYKIQIPNIIEGRTRIFYEFDSVVLRRELIKTDTFVVEPVNITPEFPGGTPHFIEKYNPDGSCDIIFGTEALGGSFPSSSSTITIFVRAGGGSLTNIPIGGINTTVNVPVSNTQQIPVRFINEANGGGGSDREDILEAQFYAPYRIGRSGGIVDDTDAINELSNMVVKHSVDSPKYSDQTGGDTVPILHYWNRIVPPRDFDSFSFPLPNENDTPQTYKEVFEKEMNSFLNVGSIHDGIEEDILTSLFRETDFSFQLPLNPALNGTIEVSAFDKNNTRIDSLKFGSNYVGILNSPNARQTRAKITSTSPVGVVAISSGVNDRLRFKIDEAGGPGVPVDSFFEIIISPGIYGLNGIKPESLASEINIKIKGASSYYNNFTGSFCFAEDDGRLSIRSLITGEHSEVQLFNSPSSILSSISLSPSYADATPENGRVFSLASNYNHTSGVVSHSINMGRFDKELNPEINIQWPNLNSDVGPSFEIFLKDKSGQVSEVQIGSNITVELYNSTDTLVDSLTFTNISSINQNNGISANGQGFDDDLNSNNVFNWESGSLKFKLTNSNRLSAPYSFPEVVPTTNDFIYDQDSYVLVKYRERTWKFSTISFGANPYIGEGESLSYLNKLRAKGKKSLAIEPLLKKVKFIPIFLEINVTPERGVSREECIRNTENIVYEDYSYDNKNQELQIGSSFFPSTLQGILGNKNRNKGIGNVSVLTETKPAANGDEYFFVFPRSFIERIEVFEETYPQISGLSSFYKPIIRVV